jgi:PAS domain S-box-containing protein
LGRALVDIPLHVEVVRRLASYAIAPDGDRDAVVADILDWANELLWRSCSEQTSPAHHEAQAHILIEQMPAIVWSTDVDLCITSFTGGGLGKVGAKPATHIAVPIQELLGTGQLAVVSMEAHRRALRGGSASFEGEWQTRTYTAYVEPLRDAAGAIVGTVGAALDITERRRAEEALARREAQLAEAQALARLGSWESEVGRGRVIWSDELYRIWGQDPDTFIPTATSIVACIHPDDRPTILAETEAVRRDGKTRSFEYRVIRPDGQIRHFHGLMSGVLDEDGNVVRLHGTCQDITDRKQAEAALASQRERQARLDGMLFAVRELASRASNGLTASTGAIGKLGPEAELPRHLQGALDDAAAGLTEALKAVDELRRLIRPTTGPDGS